MKKTKKNAVITIVLTLAVLLLCAGTLCFGIGKQHKGKAEHIKLGLDLAGGLSVTYEIKEKNATESQINDTLYKLQKRIEHYSTEASAYREGGNRISVEIPGVTDANRILAELGKPGALTFTLEDGTQIMDGSNIKSAEAKQTEENGITGYVVALSMDKKGTEAFGKATTENINKQIRIIYDGEVVSSPVVKTAITDGQCVIEGMESFESAEGLASTIRIGALPLTLKELRSNIVGATLGQDALKTSLEAGAIAVLLICVFMIFLYRVPGVMACVSLIGYILLNLLAINGFDVTLTLPGIAGILLAIGMAVDANVIIFARIQEELKAGRTVSTAIKNGHSNAMSAIVDGNITTLIAAAVLYWKGSGTVMGFAQTLGIGVLLSMFMALVVTKRLVQAAYDLGVTDARFYGKNREFSQKDFIRMSRIAIPISVAFIAAGLIFMGINQKQIGMPLNYDLEFSGGTSITMTPEQKADDSLEARIEKTVRDTVDVKTVQIQKVKSKNQVVIKTNELTLAERTKLQDKLEKEYKTREYQAEEITATVSSEMRRDAVIAVTVATFFMLIYIAFRFKDIRYGASAVIALIHDVLMVLMLYSVGRLAVGNTFIACMLTILGYSINATIVIFDRIRENTPKMKKSRLREIINTSITQTLSRSINTSLTSFVPVFLLFMMGVPAIRQFSWVLMGGIVFGLYSSVMITGPLLFYYLKI